MTNFWPGTNTPISRNNAFTDWRDGEASIFASDPKFCARGDAKESTSQIASRAVREHEEETGKSRSRIYGLSKASDNSANEFARQRALRKKGAA